MKNQPSIRQMPQACKECGDAVGGCNFYLRLYDHTPSLSLGRYIKSHDPTTCTDIEPVFDGCFQCLEARIAAMPDKLTAVFVKSWLEKTVEESGYLDGALIEIHV